MTKHVLKSKISIVIILLLFITAHGFSHWWANYAENGFVVPGDSLTGMKNDIPDGAGYFLNAYSKTLSFMNKLELSGKNVIDPVELKSLLEEALKDMESARAIYTRITDEADTNSYNREIIAALMKFDYDTFMVSNGMNREIFLEVKEKLSAGDIRGCLAKLHEDIIAITGLLENVLKKLNEGIMLPLAETWALNQEFSRSLLYGQYVSQVFGSL